jgi:hypothetical protein
MDLVAACPEFQPFNAIPDTIEYVTSVFRLKCPEHYRKMTQRLTSEDIDQ